MLPRAVSACICCSRPASAAAFTVGVTVERHTVTSETHQIQHLTEGARPGEPAEPSQASPEGGDHADSGTGTERNPASENTATHAAEQHPETILGTNPEATGLVVVAVLLSLLLAAVILTLSSPVAAAATALTMTTFAALDVAELAHQLHETNSGLAALAATVALLHLLAAATAVYLAASTRHRAAAT